MTEQENECVQSKDLDQPGWTYLQSDQNLSCVLSGELRFLDSKYSDQTELLPSLLVTHNYIVCFLMVFSRNVKSPLH